jgi:anti-anti-sigma factor
MTNRAHFLSELQQDFMSKVELIRVKTAGAAKTVSFADEHLNDITKAREIAWQLSQILDADEVVDADTDALQPRLNIDFKEIARLNSAGLNGLIGMNTQARNHGVQLVLVDVQDSVRDVFVVTRLERMFEFSKSADASGAEATI